MVSLVSVSQTECYHSFFGHVLLHVWPRSYCPFVAVNELQLCGRANAEDQSCIPQTSFCCAIEVSEIVIIIIIIIDLQR